MNKESLKTILKPVLKECLEEILAEQGLLKVLAEAQIGSEEVVVETKKQEPVKKPEIKDRIQKKVVEAKELVKQELNENHKRMQQELRQAGLLNNKFNPFAGTKALTESQASDTQAARGPLASVDPQDKGVDISGIVGMAAGKWKAHMGGKGK